MKQLTEYTRVSGYLVKIFRALNETYFENALAIPVITIQSTPKAFGHVTVSKVWTSQEEERHELNIGAGTLNRPIEHIVATMLHEMVHLYHLANGIKDVSRGGAYHNKKFRDAATARDLIIEHDEKYGWTLTTPSDNLVEWCIAHDLEEIKVVRHDFSFALPPLPPAGGKAVAPTPTQPPKKPSSTRKYQCPECGASCRATRTLSLICGACFKPDEAPVYMTEA